jgi:hypothetical protein
MSRPNRSFQVFLLVVFFQLLLAAASAQSFRPANKPFKLPDIVGLKENKRSCCGGMSAVKAGLPRVAAEYEYYRLTGTYYSLKDGLSAGLMFNNKGPESILATPTFYSLAGTKLQLAPIAVPATSYLEVDLHQLLANADEEFREGSMKVDYQGGDYQLGVQVKLADPAKKLIWAEQFIYTSKLTSSRLESVWHLPFEGSTVKLIVSNTTYSPVTVTLSSDGTEPAQLTPLQITLNRSETRILDIPSNLVGNPNASLETKGGVSISHSGQPGAVVARILAGKADRGYSASIPFVDPENTSSQRWHGNGLRLRNLNGAALHPVLAARNTGNTISRIKGKIPYTSPNGDVAYVDVPEAVIPANTTRIINLQGRIASSGMPATVDYAGIELEYDTIKGSVVTAVQSVSPSGEHVFQVPMFDPQKMPSSAGGFPWKADGDYSTIVYVKNETNTPKKFVTSLLFDGGGYSVGLREAKGGQTVAIDFREIRDNQTPDARGKVIPLGVDSGQIAWSVHGPNNKTLSGRSEQVSVSGGVASTYSCANCCPNRHYNSWMTPYSVYTAWGEVTAFAPMQQDKNCSGQPLPAYSADVSGWDSTDWNVASVWNGSATAVGFGSSNIQATWEAADWWYESQRCDYIPVPVFEEAPMEVVPTVTITPFHAVGKDGTFSVPVQVSGNNNNSQITLHLKKLSGTGESQFTSNNSSTITVTQTGAYEIKGITESSAKDNYVVEANLNNSILATEAFSIAKIRLTRTVGTGSPSEITSTTINTIVGERIKLAAEVLPAGITIASSQWTIPQKIMNDFVVTANSSSVSAVSGLNTANANFVWYDGADGREVKYVAAAGGEIAGKAIFNVKRPEASVVTISTTGSSTSIDTATGSLEMHYGGNTVQTAGIRFSRSFLAVPSPFSGATQWVQTTSASISATTTGNVTSSAAASGLDGCYPFTSSVTNAWDSPGFKLDGYIYVNLSANWSMWLMFKPSGDDSSWVPLRKVDWRWLSEAQQISGVWTLVSHTDPHQPSQPIDADSSSFPLWTSVIGTCD